MIITIREIRFEDRFRLDPRSHNRVFSQALYRNGNIANFVLVLPLLINQSNIAFSIKMQSCFVPRCLILYLLVSVGANKEENCQFMGIQSWQ